MKRIIGICLMVLACLATEICFADDVIIFEKDYKREIGKPAMEVDSFYSIGGKSKVIIYNGDKDDDSASSALVLLNNQEMGDICIL